MAKKRKDIVDGEIEKKSDDGFEFPEFDTAKFVAKEKRSIRATMLAFGWGLVMAIICFGFWVLMSGSFFRWELVLLLAVVNASFIKYFLIKVGIDVSHWTRKNWLGNLATYFFSWILIFIVLVNPPIYDDAPPMMDCASLPGVQEMNGTVLIACEIIDNVLVEKQGINFMLTDPGGIESTPSFEYENYIFTYTFHPPLNLTEDSTYTYVIEATDVNGHTSHVLGDFTYTSDALKIVSSQRTGLMSGDKISIKADPEIASNNFRLYYMVDGVEVNASREDPGDKEMYETSPEYEGWEEESNETVRLYAEVYQYFWNLEGEYTNTVIDGDEYEFSTGSDNDIGTVASPSTTEELGYSLPSKKELVATPGFEVLGAIMAIGICLIAVRRKKRDE